MAYEASRWSSLSKQQTDDGCHWFWKGTRLAHSAECIRYCCICSCCAMMFLESTGSVLSMGSAIA